MKVLVAGYGLIGRQRVQALTSSQAVKSITVYDPAVTPGRELTLKAKSLGWREALAEKYDAAIVATPHDVAAGMLPEVLGVANSVLCEKPLGRTEAEASQLLSAAEKSASQLYVGFNYRFLRNVQHLRKILAEETLGRVLAVDAVLGHGAQPGYENGWKTDRSRCGGGVCIDPGVHVFDLLQWLFGAATLTGGVLGRSYWPIEVEDHASLSFSLSGGAIGSVFLTLSSWQSRFEMNVELEKGQILLRGRGKFYGPQTLTVVTKWPWLEPALPRETVFNYGAEDSSLTEETHAFLSAVGAPGESGHVATGKEAYEIMKIVDRCYSDLIVAAGGPTLK